MGQEAGGSKGGRWWSGEEPEVGGGEAKKNMPTTDWDYACDVASQLELRRA